MKKIAYYTLKIVIGVIIALYISNVLGLSYPVSVAIITMLSVKETRQESIHVALKRLLIGNVAILMSFILFYFLGFHIYVLAIFLLFFIPLAIILRARESIISGLVLVSHILSFKEISMMIFYEENLVLIVGIITGFFLIIHMPKKEKELNNYIAQIESSFSNVLLNMSYNLRNLCFIKEDENLFELEVMIKKAKALSFENRDNYLFDKENYYIKYFQMRLMQLYRLMYMQDHFNQIFITQQQAVPLSNMTGYIASIIGQEPDLSLLLEDINELREHFSNEPLPKNRLEFENRSVLFQYLNDLEEFIVIKKRYLQV